MSKIGLIVQREYNQRVKKRTFILTTLLMPLFFIGIMVVPGLLAVYGGSEKREVVVVDNSGVIGGKLQSSDVVDFELASQGYPEVVDVYQEAFGFLVIEPDVVEKASKMTLYTRESTTMELERELRDQVGGIIERMRIEGSGIEGIDSLLAHFNVSVPIQTYSIGESVDAAKESSSALSMGIAYIAGFVIYMFIFLYGAQVMNGVIEEKSNRIIEVIVSSVKPFELMMGKIIGIALVALTQVFIWVILVSVGAAVVQGMMSADATAVAGEVAQEMPSKMGGVLSAMSDMGYIGTVVVSFIVFFLGGYLLYAAMFAAIGSGVDNAADTQQLQMPVTLPLILALILMMSVMHEPNSALAFWFSMIPFTSPIIMMARVAYGVPLWELLLSMAILYGSFVMMTMFAAKIYRVGIFMYGKKPSLKELIRWSKFKS